MFIGNLPMASNRADWSESFELYDDETGELLDLSTVTIDFQLRDDCRHVDGLVVVTGLGSFNASFSKDDLGHLCSGTYAVGCTMTSDDGTVTQTFVGNLPVIDGVVRP